jgi:predicted Rossmann-fold nucleotide-binding protein
MFSPLPFSPIRASLEHTVDFDCFVYYVTHGRSAPRDQLSSLFEALHDKSITQATIALLQKWPRVAGIMGGHDEPRGSDVYSAVARMSAALSGKGFLMASGGGPGAMEATHLGASFRGDPGSLKGAIDTLKNEAPKLPVDAGKVIAPDGTVDPKIARALYEWVMPAYRLSQKAKGESLALPTWYYGHEPTTPFATHIAKYFQNSIREDGLIALAAHGIIFASGRAGTLQEIFQDTVRNYYRTAPDAFSPMVFFGKAFWIEQLPATVVLRALFKLGKREQEYIDNVLVTDDEAETVEFLVRKSPPPDAHLERLRTLGLLV